MSKLYFEDGHDHYYLVHSNSEDREGYNVFYSELVKARSEWEALKIACELNNKQVMNQHGNWTYTFDEYCERHEAKKMNVIERKNEY